MRRHFKSRFPQLNVNRLREKYATNTWFATVPSLGGSEAVQFFVGTKLHFMRAYGMKEESEGVGALEDFIRETGAPYHIVNDNSKMQTSKAWIDILRRYNIADSTNEPHNQQQNPAERHIQVVKNTSNTILDQTRAPAELWLLCVLYVVFLLNRTANATLGWRTPMEVAFGETPDLSVLLQYSFYEEVLYLDHDTKYPESKEKPGYFVGIAENCGDALTYLILTKDTNQVICQSVVRPADNETHPNLRASPDWGEGALKNEKKEFIYSINELT